MRQAGVLAAAGIVALECMTERLTEDHVRATRLAHGLAEIKGLHLKQVDPPTNMVFATIDEQAGCDAAELAHRLQEYRVKVGLSGKMTMRMVLIIGSMMRE